MTLFSRGRGVAEYLEEQEGDDGGRLGCDVLGEVERAEEGRRVHESGEEREDGKDVKLGGKEHLGWVHVVPVTEFMRWRREVNLEVNLPELECYVPRTASTSSGLLSLMSVSKMTMCLLYVNVSLRYDERKRSC